METVSYPGDGAAEFCHCGSSAAPGGVVRLSSLAASFRHRRCCEQFGSGENINLIALSLNGMSSERPVTRRIMLVALARKLIVALWRYVEIGLVPAGAISCVGSDTALEAAAV